MLSELVFDALRSGVSLRADLAKTCGKDIVRAAELIIECIEKGNKVLVFGNGGSASDAQHIAAEFVGRYVLERKPLPAIALTVDTSALTAIGNDYGFDAIFERQVEALGVAGDVVIAITTSGKSPNVVRAVEKARAMGLKIIGLTGAKGADFARSCDAGIAIPALVTARIQECHITVGHILCEAVDASVSGALRAAKPASGERRSTAEKERNLQELVQLRARWKAEKRTVIWTNGVFDVLHAGHLTSLRAARALGDILIVGVNADATVKKAKGPDRPVYPLAERLLLLAALEPIDYVLAFDEDTPEAVLGALQPDIHCKGADYAPPNGKPIPEAKLVASYGGRIEYLPFVEGRSTTSTVAKLIGS